MKQNIGFALLALALMMSAATGAQELKVLFIGNSFTQGLMPHMGYVVESTGNQIELEQAAIGGHSLRQHYSKFERGEKPYSIGGKKLDLGEALAAKDYDAVVIQEYSSEVDPAETEEFLGKILDLIKTKAPQVKKIYYMETWPYRVDSPVYAQKNITQQQWADQLRQTAKRMGKRYGLTVIPCGTAIQLARDTQQVKFKPATQEELGKAKYPKLPDETGSFAVGAIWEWHGNNTSLYFDYKHLKERGAYLQACVAAAVLFGVSPEDVKVDGKYCTAQDSEFLRRTAKLALEKYNRSDD